MLAILGGLLRPTLRRTRWRGQVSQAAQITDGCTRLLSTLDPARLSLEDFLDVSGRLQATCPVPSFTRSALIGYGHALDPDEKKSKRRGFPPQTQGFLYFVPGPPHAPAAGEIRFRVTGSADPAAFEGGHDLVSARTTLPWRISLSAIVHEVGYSPFLHLLRDNDQCVQGPLVQALLASAQLRSSVRNIVHSAGQPFYVNFSSPRFDLWVASGDQLFPFSVAVAQDQRKGAPRAPYQGRRS
jgi:hypothetical protein